MRCVFAVCGMVWLCALVGTGDEKKGQEWRDADKAKNVQPILKQLMDGVRHEHVMVPMRDGVKLATELFLPPGKGPWPVVLMRTPYGRFNGGSYASRLKKQPIALVTQDPRGDGHSEGRDTMDPVNSENEIADGYDTVDWIVRQPWCNGRIGMFGGSGHGMCACMAYLCGHSNLVVCAPGNSGANTALYWAFENGVRRANYDWLVHRGLRIQEWPKPTLMNYDAAAWQAKLPSYAKNNRTIFMMGDGWYNIFGDSLLEWFGALAPEGRIFVSMGSGAHDKAEGLAFPKNLRRPYPKVESLPSFLEILQGTEVKEQSRLIYYMLGDVDDDQAPGCEWRVARQWPVPHTPKVLKLTADGALRQDAQSMFGSVTYKYDPRNPAPTLGGHHFYGKQPSGALDQRPLKERKDVLCFYSEPLTEPLAMTGRAVADLFVSMDVKDTALILKLVDVYPDGFEALLRETAFMARYRKGLDQPEPMPVGEVCRMRFELGATSIAFNKGHRIGLILTNSSTPAYEVHPNTYELVSSYDDAPIADITVHTGKKHPSSLILPVVE